MSLDYKGMKELLLMSNIEQAAAVYQALESGFETEFDGESVLVFQA